MSAGTQWLSWLAVCLCTCAAAQQISSFTGPLAVELIEGIDANHQFRLLEAFSFTDATGRHWRAPAGSVVDDEAVPRDLSTLTGLPYVAEYRKAAMLHSHFRQTRSAPWRANARMLYESGRVEGLGEPQAKALYATVYAAGWRWEPRGSSCFRSCHASAPALAWKPKATLAELQPVIDWVMQSGADLDAIDARVDAAIARPGPHLFAQVR